MPPRGLHCSLGKKLGPETWPEGSEKGEYILETASRAQEKQRNGILGFRLSLRLCEADKCPGGGVNRGRQGRQDSTCDCSGRRENPSAPGA